MMVKLMITPAFVALVPAIPKVSKKNTVDNRRPKTMPVRTSRFHGRLGSPMTMRLRKTR